MFHRYVFVGSETMLISIIAGTLCSMIDSILSLYSPLLRFKCGFLYDDVFATLDVAELDCGPIQQ
jgi:hypothetical protein